MFRKRSWDLKAQKASSWFHGLLSTRLTAHVIIYALGWEELGWEGPTEAWEVEAAAPEEGAPREWLLGSV